MGWPETAALRPRADLLRVLRLKTPQERGMNIGLIPVTTRRICTGTECPRASLYPQQPCRIFSPHLLFGRTRKRAGFRDETDRVSFSHVKRIVSPKQDVITPYLLYE